MINGYLYTMHVQTNVKTCVYAGIAILPLSILLYMTLTSLVSHYHAVSTGTSAIFMYFPKCRT